MRAVVQRVSRAQIEVRGETIAQIGPGLLVLLGVAEGDQTEDAEYLAEKIVGLRIFEDAEGKLNRSLAEAKGELMLVSQFTLMGDCRKGRRPSFSHAAAPHLAEELYHHFAKCVSDHEVSVATGHFGEHMEVGLLNDGPVTLLLDSRRLF